jgi:hypothetical protein
LQDSLAKSTFGAGVFVVVSDEERKRIKDEKE